MRSALVMTALGLSQAVEKCQCRKCGAVHIRNSAARRPVQTERALGFRQLQVLDLLASNAVDAAKISEKLGITLVHACVLLSNLFNLGLVTREGEQGSYRYAKAKQAA